MNNKIIEVLDYLGEKIGLAIDWSANNVYPQVMEFLTRYRTYEIATNGIWMLVCIAYMVFVFIFIKKTVIPNRQKALESKHSTWLWEYCSGWNRDDPGYISGLDTGGIFFIVFGGTLLIMSIIGIIYCGDAIAKWIFIPEAQFYNIIAGLMQ